MNYVGIVKTAQNMQDGIGFTNIGQELIAQPLAFTRPFYEAAISTISTEAGTILPDEPRRPVLRAWDREPVWSRYWVQWYKRKISRLSLAELNAIE
jgi:hypothetical protein